MRATGKPNLQKVGAMSPHQLEMVRALCRVPPGKEFCSGDMAKVYGYPYKDASTILQQLPVLDNFLQYSNPSYRAGKIRYKLKDDFNRQVALYDMRETRKSQLDRRAPQYIMGS